MILGIRSPRDTDMVYPSSIDLYITHHSVQLAVFVPETQELDSFHAIYNSISSVLQKKKKKKIEIFYSALHR